MTPHAGTGEPYTPQQPKIANRCPECGARSLFIGAGGWLTCGVIGCKRPAFDDALEASEARHRAVHAALLASLTKAEHALRDRAHWPIQLHDAGLFLGLAIGFAAVQIVLLATNGSRELLVSVGILIAVFAGLSWLSYRAAGRRVGP